MFSWIPRWHPLVWLVVIVLFVAVVSNPTGMGQRVGDMVHWLGHAASQLTVFVENI